MTVHASLESVEHLVAFDEFAKDGLVAVEVASGTEGDGELRSARVLSVVRDGQLATFIVSHGHILILEAHAKGTNVLLADATGRDSKSTLSLMELTVHVGVALGTFAEGLERVGSLWLSLGVKLENEVTDVLVTVGYGKVNFRVGWAGVAVQRAEATLAEVEQLF